MKKPAKAARMKRKPDKGWALLNAAQVQMKDESHEAFISLPKSRQKDQDSFHAGYVRGYVTATCRSHIRNRTPHPDTAKELRAAVKRWKAEALAAREQMRTDHGMIYGDWLHAKIANDNAERLSTPAKGKVKG